MTTRRWARATLCLGALGLAPVAGCGNARDQPGHEPGAGGGYGSNSGGTGPAGTGAGMTTEPSGRPAGVDPDRVGR